MSVTENKDKSPIPVPEFEQRAEVFMVEVDQMRKEDEGYNWHSVSFIMEKDFPGRICGYDALQRILDTEGGIDLPIQPKDLADELDQRSVDECVVSVSTHMDSYRPLETFMTKILSIAERHKAEIDTTGLFGTQGETDFIDCVGDEASGRIFYARLYFSFK